MSDFSQEKFIKDIQRFPWVVNFFQDITLSPKGRSLRYKNKTMKPTADGLYFYYSTFNEVGFFICSIDGVKKIYLRIKNKHSDGSSYLVLVGDDVHCFINFCKSDKLKEIINYV